MVLSLVTDFISDTSSLGWKSKDPLAEREERIPLSYHVSLPSVWENTYIWFAILGTLRPSLPASGVLTRWDTRTSRNFAFPRGLSRLAASFSDGEVQGSTVSSRTNPLFYRAHNRKLPQEDGFHQVNGLLHRPFFNETKQGFRTSLFFQWSLRRFTYEDLVTTSPSSKR